MKQKLLNNLLKRKYYKSCAIVEKHLVSFPVPIERTFKRKKEKFTKDVNENIAKQIYQLSNLLVMLKTTAKEKLCEPEIKEPLSKLLNFESSSNDLAQEHLDSMEWLLKNAPHNLKEMFADEICRETKDKLLRLPCQKRTLYIVPLFLRNIENTGNVVLL